MTTKTDPWEPWHSELQQAYEANDVVRIRKALVSLRLDFHGQRNSHHDRWDALFHALVALVGSEDADVRRLSYHYVMIVAEAEYGPPYEGDSRSRRQDNFRRRTLALLPALAKEVDSDPAFLLGCADRLAFAEELVDLAPQEEVVRWIESLLVPEPTRLAARIAYVDARAPWQSARPLLFEALDHDDVIVRAVAARSIGKRYLETPDGEIEPAFKEVAELITEKELQRPGIAGPLLSSWYTGDIDSFEKRAEIKIDEWLCRILAHRKGHEPNTLPCSNGIDFFAHEVFGGRADYIRKLLALGHEALAVEAATEIDEKIEDVEPILMDLGASSDNEVCRRASWHLAYHYRRLHPEGAKRGFVREAQLPSAQLFLNLTGEADRTAFPYAATLYPIGAASFDDRDARRYVDRVLPPSVRGAMVAYGMPGDRDQPGVYVLGKRASSRYSTGAFVSFRFFGEPLPIDGLADQSILSTQRWEQIRIIWHGAPNVWNPELLLQSSH